MLLRPANILVLAAVCVFAAGCASGPAVPKDAKLIWYGQSGFQFPDEDLPSGTFYLVEDWLGKRTVAAAYRKQGQPVHFSGLKRKRSYHLFFAAAPAQRSTTRPVAAGGGA